MPGAIISIDGLKKSFGDVHALNGVDLAVDEGTVLGLLGPNGAGKTTTVRVLATLLPPDEGRVSVAGYDVVRDAKRLRRVIGLAGQYAAVDPNLTGLENLMMVGRLYHLSKAEARRRAESVLERFELAYAANRTAKTYSGGMRRRLDLGASLVGRAKVLFLDEPTTGLDPRSRVGMWELIHELVSDGTTLLLTTQYLDEADELSDKIAVIDGGRVIAEGTADTLKDRVGGTVLDVKVDRPHYEQAVAALAGLVKGGETLNPEHSEITLPVAEGGPQVMTEAVRRLDSAGVTITDLAYRKPTLDDVFLTLTGHVAEEEKGDEAGDAATGRRGRKRSRSRRRRRSGDAAS
jgi:ABC-2 type transport system ATP-binding protein